MMIDSYSDWEVWAQANGYEPDFYDEEEEPYKREVNHSGYALHTATNTYALVTWSSHYDYGSCNYEVQTKGLHRVERQVTKTEVFYE